METFFFQVHLLIWKGAIQIWNYHSLFPLSPGRYISSIVFILLKEFQLFKVYRVRISGNSFIAPLSPSFLFLQRKFVMPSNQEVFPSKLVVSMLWWGWGEGEGFKRISWREIFKMLILGSYP